VIADDTVVFWPAGQLSVDAPGVHSRAKTAEQLATGIEELYRRCWRSRNSRPWRRFTTWTHRFQDNRGETLRAKRDAVYELRMRGDYLVEWTEPQRLRALAGSATPQDLHVLGMADQALEQLIELVHRRYADFLSQSR
jgi:hypothetical protein